MPPVVAVQRGLRDATCSHDIVLLHELVRDANKACK